MKECVKLIGESTVKKYLIVEDVIKRVEDTWRWYGSNNVIMPSKVTLDMSKLGLDSWMNAMPSYIKETDFAGIKWVGGFSGNPQNGLSFIRAKVLLADPHNGNLHAIVSGDWISDMRTGAQPAIMAKYLAEKADIVTIIGAGAQGYTSLLCMSKILDIKEVRVCDINSASRKSFIKRFEGTSFKMVECTDNETACRGSDIIITVTTANVPLVQEPWVKNGALVMTMGSFTEISDDLMRKADKLITDHIGQALHRGTFAELAAKGEITASSFSAEIPYVITGSQEGRTCSDERIVAAIIGMGALDASIAALLLERIEEAGDNLFEFDFSM